MIDQFVNCAFQLLKPGGRLIGINTSPFIQDQETFDKTMKYSLEYTTDEAPIKEGDPLHICIKLEDGEAKFDNYFWKPETYEASFKTAGFIDMQWNKFTIEEGCDEQFWQTWLENCPLICFSAVKPN